MHFCAGGNACPVQATPRSLNVTDGDRKRAMLRSPGSRTRGSYKKPDPTRKQTVGWNATSSSNDFQAPRANAGSICTNDLTANFIFKSFMRPATTFRITGPRHMHRRDWRPAYTGSARKRRATCAKWRPGFTKIQSEAIGRGAASQLPRYVEYAHGVTESGTWYLPSGSATAKRMGTMPRNGGSDIGAPRRAKYSATAKRSS
jgi:hypothetical protein